MASRNFYNNFIYVLDFVMHYIRGVHCSREFYNKTKLTKTKQIRERNFENTSMTV